MYESWKRGLDIVIVVGLSPLWMPLAGLVAAAIWMTMGPPVIFAQDRVGRGGRPFRMYKFRTMSAWEPGPPRATEQNDPRVTKIGKILRRYHLDEIPQCWNLLIGDMSLIGPRPEQPQISKFYEDEISGYALRHAIRPGITGWAQIKFGYAANIDETREKLSYDLYYLKYGGWELDLKIAIMTIRAVLLGSNSR